MYRVFGSCKQSESAQFYIAAVVLRTVRVLHWLWEHSSAVLGLQCDVHSLCYCFVLAAECNKIFMSIYAMFGMLCIAFNALLLLTMSFVRKLVRLIQTNFPFLLFISYIIVISLSVYMNVCF